MIDNSAIADQFSLLAKLMDIHGENSFKSKSYASAAFTIEKLPQALSELSQDKIFKLKGIGESTGKKVLEIIESGKLKSLKEYLEKTPEGVLEMMNVKGLGPKKINTLWKELEIDTIEKLEKACLENQVAEKKGFGEKTQQKILESISFQKENTGRYLYAQAEAFAEAFKSKISGKFINKKLEFTGPYRRQIEIIDRLDFVTTISKEDLKNFLLSEQIQIEWEKEDSIEFNAENTLLIHFYLASEESFFYKLFETSASESFLETWRQQIDSNKTFSSEEEIFTEAGIHYIPPFLREREKVIDQAKNSSFENIIQTSDIKGLIHSHSNWSDGAYTIEEMANALISTGFEYMVISDHSKAAYYANGLSEERIREQHLYIDELNKKLKPFKIFKSIECDILNDGSLDYDNKTLASLDLVIVSIHSNLDMDEEKGMMRLMGAIANPYTTILGHMTGRRLLKRKGYPINHQAIIDACAKHDVVIEINANPQRLDMEWQWVDAAIEKNVLLSINPDAHTTEEFKNIKYGTLVAQKGGLIKEKNLSSFSLLEFEDFLKKTKERKGIS